MSAVSKFISETCGCELGPKKIPCSTYLTKETIVQCRACCLELDHDEQDLVVLEQIQAHRTTLQQSTVSKGHHNVKETFRSHADYFIHGVIIFRFIFQFIYCLSDKCFRNLTQHYDMNGLVTCVHGNSKRLPHTILTLENTEKVTAFIKTMHQPMAFPFQAVYLGIATK